MNHVLTCAAALVLPLLILGCAETSASRDPSTSPSKLSSTSTVRNGESPSSKPASISTPKVHSMGAKHSKGH